MLLKSQPMKNQPEVAVVPAVVPKLFPQQMVAHVFSLFMEAVVMALVSQWTKVWDILWMPLVIISNLFLHLLHKMVFGWEIHQDRVYLANSSVQLLNKNEIFWAFKRTLWKGKDQPTNDPAWADVALNYLDDFIAQNGPFYAMLGYSQGQFFK